MPGLRVEEPVVDAVVGVGAVAVDDLAEQALADHVQHGQVVAAEAPVLEHHAGDAGLFVGVDQIPAFFQGIGRGNFDGGVFPGFHGINRHGRMPLPVCGDNDGIQVIPVHQFFKGIFVFEVGLRLGSSGLDDHIHRQIQMGFLDIAEGRDLHILHTQQDVHQGAAPIPGADHTDTCAFLGSGS